jgi:hypothetical protein
MGELEVQAMANMAAIATRAQTVLTLRLRTARLVGKVEGVMAKLWQRWSGEWRGVMASWPVMASTARGAPVVAAKGGREGRGRA